MKKISFLVNDLAFRKVLVTISMAVVVLSVAFLLPITDPNAKTRVLYFAIILGYIIIGSLLVQDFDKMSGFWFSVLFCLMSLNVIFILLSVVGIIANLFVPIPFPFGVIFGWPSVVSVFIFFFLTLFGLFIPFCWNVYDE